MLRRISLTLLALSSPLPAQFDSGQISGYVRDASQAIVSGATVLCINDGTPEQRQPATNQSGYYIFPNLPVRRGTFDPDSVSNGGFNINGGRAEEYNVVVDGAIATRTRSSGSMLGAQDVDTVQEVQILTATYAAEYGRSSAGQIRFVTKSGTQAFHGDLVENFRNSAMDANDWTRNHSSLVSQSTGPAPF